ncbi:MAG: hypothetical protein HYV67_00550 [Candidatus Taylorbacteria bacterium]|nr:hypothetical protein [Candidatus Taylorbacteria bacterium]
MPQTTKGGFIKLIILLVVVLVVLGYFGFNIENIFNSPTVSGNLHYAWSLAVSFWNKFLVIPATWVWNKIIIGVVWNSLIAILDKAQPISH